MLALFLIAAATIILVCVFLNNFSTKIGLPVLLLFILFGMLYGWYEVPEDLTFVEDVCTAALIFIMFYGGFGTNWKTARPVAVPSGILATLGVFLTAFLTGGFCHYALGWNWIESLLLGSVISSTDAATVFSILRNRKLGLKENAAPMVEIESGSNDPCSYMLTIVMLSVLSGTASGWGIVYDVFAQFVYGAGIGVGIALIAKWILRRRHFANGFDSLFIMSVALMSYALPTVVGGNGYLSVYIVGIMLGNIDFAGKKSLVGFFDGVTSFMQILIFFLLGYIIIPMKIPYAIIPAILIFLFLTIVSRPVSVFAILAPFRRYSGKMLSLVSFVGLRGAASLVFAMMTLPYATKLENDIFSTVFCIVLISIALQGSLIPMMSKRLKMIDEAGDSTRTFSDYADNEEINFSTITVKEESKLAGLAIRDMGLPHEMLITLVERNNKFFVPHGDTVIEPGDNLVITSRSFNYEITGRLMEHPLSKGSRWAGKAVKEYPYKDGSILITIKRGAERIIPHGNTILQEGDVLVIVK